MASSTKPDIFERDLQTSLLISVDDTGARHKAANGFCNVQIGNDRFTSGSAQLVIEELAELPRSAACRPYRLRVEWTRRSNMMRERVLSAPLIGCLAAQPETIFADQVAWSAHLDRLGFTVPDHIST